MNQGIIVCVGMRKFLAISKNRAKLRDNLPIESWVVDWRSDARQTVPDPTHSLALLLSKSPTGFPTNR
jgi:hypothetical protein